MFYRKIALSYLPNNMDCNHVTTSQFITKVIFIVNSGSNSYRSSLRISNLTLIVIIGAIKLKKYTIRILLLMNKELAYSTVYNIFSSTCELIRTRNRYY